jgi:2-polyprenyl-3-methyl-5-hydroxy-6-metoxy-1,4-benzoquinol methylase
MQDEQTSKGYYSAENKEKSKLLDAALTKEGLAYAERNLLSDDSHLHLDKAFIAENFNLDGKKVLDFGCGMGSMALWIRKKYKCDIRGIDIDRNHLLIANLLKVKHNLPDVAFNYKDVLVEPLTSTYDFIYLNDVAEHIPLTELQVILSHLTKQLNTGGVMFVSYPPWEGPFASHLNVIFQIPWAQYWPKFILNPLLEKRNKTLVGEKDLKSEFHGLNQLNHRKFKRIAEKAGLRIIKRKSHTKLNLIPGLKNINFNIFPFYFLITKELLVLELNY